jgi:hypothetical protein
VALSAGARVVHVAAGRLDAGGVAALRAARPDVLLLVGGTDGGEADSLIHNARRLASARGAPGGAGRQRRRAVRRLRALAGRPCPRGLRQRAAARRRAGARPGPRRDP